MENEWIKNCINDVENDFGCVILFDLMSWMFFWECLIFFYCVLFFGIFLIKERCECNINILYNKCILVIKDFVYEYFKLN